MGRWDLHGRVVESRCAAGEDPAEALLGLLPPAPAGAAPDLVIETSVAAEPGELAPRGQVAFSLLGVELRLAADGGATVSGHGGAITLQSYGLRVRLRAPLDGPGALIFAQVPLLVAVLAVLRARGMHHLHAGAVVAPGGGTVLVAGETGSGKSTLTAALAAAGCGWLGDDVVLVAAGPRLLSFPRPFHLSDEAAGAVLSAGPVRPSTGSGRTDLRVSARGDPSRGSARGEPVEPRAESAAGDQPRRSVRGKLALDPRDLFPGREHREAPAPAVVLFPRVTGEPTTTLRPLSKADAFGRLVESSALVAVKALAGTREHLALLAAVADGARTLEVDLGRDLLADAARTAGRVLGEALP